MRSIIACIKLFFFGLLCVFSIPIQTLWLWLFKNSPLYFVYPQVFNRSVLFIFGIKVKIYGIPKTESHVIFVGNHLSYIDIPVLGGNLPAIFIAKADVRNWPVFGTLASISQTIYIERHRNAAPQAIKDIENSLQDGRSLILFPEGTSSQGIEVLPFKSSLFEIFLDKKLKENLVIQPFTLTLQKINNLTPKDAKEFDTYAWYADMELPPHLWDFAKSKGVTIHLTFHPARKAIDYNDRKDFAQDCWRDVATGLQKSLPAFTNIHP
ncbi:MAG: lysophospholipid acyltransferase family protein [Alphaproteobacteria bacterium]|nr:lysophospholipid acyltransferase family protein [Alphaproteobacteria bacterium]